MSRLLTDEEIRTALQDAMRKAQDYGDDGKPLPERAIAQAQRDADVRFWNEKKD